MEAKAGRLLLGNWTDAHGDSHEQSPSEQPAEQEAAYRVDAAAVAPGADGGDEGHPGCSSEALLPVTTEQWSTFTGLGLSGAVLVRVGADRMSWAESWRRRGTSAFSLHWVKRLSTSPAAPSVLIRFC